MDSNQYSDVTDDSAVQGNAAFFNTQQELIVAPSHSASITWKSPWMKEKEEFDRVRHRIRHFAPAMFRANGAGVFPQNVSEWIEHKKEYLAMAEADMHLDIANMQDMIVIKEQDPKGQKITKAFGGKVFDDGLSPVLALPTVFAPNYAGLGANWPSRGESQRNGDGRQNAQARTKCGRFLPQPRFPDADTLTVQDQGFIKPLPLDETGPIYHTGPRPDEVIVHTALMDNDPEFEAKGAALVGSDLMAEVGEWSEPYIPGQQYEHLQLVPEEMDMQYRYLNHDMCSAIVRGMAGPRFAYRQRYNMPEQYDYFGHEQQPGVFYPGQNEHLGFWYGPPM